MGGKSEQEGRRWVDYRRDRARYWAALRLGALLLRLRLWLSLLGLFDLLAGPAAYRVAGERGGRPESRQSHCTDDEPPLHAAEVTTPTMNGK